MANQNKKSLAQFHSGLFAAIATLGAIQNSVQANDWPTAPPEGQATPTKSATPATSVTPAKPATSGSLPAPSRTPIRTSDDSRTITVTSQPVNVSRNKSAPQDTSVGAEALEGTTKKALSGNGAADLTAQVAYIQKRVSVRPVNSLPDSADGVKVPTRLSESKGAKDSNEDSRYWDTFREAKAASRKQQRTMTPRLSVLTDEELDRIDDAVEAAGVGLRDPSQLEAMRQQMIDKAIAEKEALWKAKRAKIANWLRQQKSDGTTLLPSNEPRICGFDDTILRAYEAKYDAAMAKAEEETKWLEKRSKVLAWGKAHGLISPGQRPCMGDFLVADQEARGLEAAYDAASDGGLKEKEEAWKEKRARILAWARQSNDSDFSQLVESEHPREPGDLDGIARQLETKYDAAQEEARNTTQRNPRITTVAMGGALGFVVEVVKGVLTSTNNTPNTDQELRERDRLIAQNNSKGQ